MALHVIVGAGPVGTATAHTPARRRPPGPGGHPQRHRHPTGVERVAADAADADRLTELGQRRRGALQLREPALPPLADRLAAGGRGHADRGRAQPARCW